MNVELSEKELELILKWAGHMDADLTWMTDEEVMLFEKISNLLGA